MEMKNIVKNKESRTWLAFVGKSLLYTTILIGLVYLYHYSSVGGGSFIYNQF